MQVHALVVDSVDLTRDQLLAALDKCGLAQFRFTETSTYTDALACFDPQVMDVVFVALDTQDLKKVGTKLLGVLRRRQSKKHVPVVAVTNEPTARQLENLVIDLGIDYYVIRPFNANTIGNKLAGLMEMLKQKRKQRTRAVAY